MSDSQKKAKPTLETLLLEGQVLSGRDVIEKNKLKEKELRLFQEALEFEERNRQSKRVKAFSSPFEGGHSG